MPRTLGNQARVNLNRVIVDDNGFTNVYIGGYTANPDTDGAANGYGVYWGPGHSKYIQLLFQFIEFEQCRILINSFSTEM